MKERKKGRKDKRKKGQKEEKENKSGWFNLVVMILKRNAAQGLI